MTPVFLLQQDFEILYLQKFPLVFDLNGSLSRVNRHLSSSMGFIQFPFLLSAFFFFFFFVL